MAIKRLLPVLLPGLLALTAAAALKFTVFGQEVYYIYDAGRTICCESADSVQAALRQAGVTLGADDGCTVSRTQDGVTVRVQRRQTVTVMLADRQMTCHSRGEPVGALLARYGLSPTDGQRLDCPENAMTYDGMCIHIIEVTHRLQTRRLTVPAGVRRYESDDLPPGEELVVQEGCDGCVELVGRVTLEDGVPVCSQVVSRRVVRCAKDRVVLYGVDRAVTQPPASSAGSAAGSGSGQGVLTTAGGDVLHYAYALSVIATAYSCEGYTGITATGTVARYGAIAVDPSVIPYGTRMYIVSDDGQYIYGYATAEDCGGGIKGNRIDLYFNTVSECWVFGRRSCTVYILD